MFEATIDNKPKTMDPNGNEIVDLTTPIFRNNEKITSYRLRRVPSDFAMRPDLEAFVELGSIDHTEYIMMFNAVGNPFSIDKDDVLLIPNLIEAQGLVYSYTDQYSLGGDPNDASIQDLLVRNYYKHSRRHNTVDMSSYDKFEDTAIPSGNPDFDDKYNAQGESTVPYLLGKNETAVKIKNGRIYLTEGSGTPQIDTSEITSANIDAKIQSIICGVGTDLSDSNCVYNGSNLADFIKAMNECNELQRPNSNTTS